MIAAASILPFRSISTAAALVPHTLPPSPLATPRPPTPALRPSAKTRGASDSDRRGLLRAPPTRRSASSRKAAGKVLARRTSRIVSGGTPTAPPGPGPRSHSASLAPGMVLRQATHGPKSTRSIRSKRKEGSTRGGGGVGYESAGDATIRLLRGRLRATARGRRYVSCRKIVASLPWNAPGSLTTALSTFEARRFPSRERVPLLLISERKKKRGQGRGAGDWGGACR